VLVKKVKYTDFNGNAQERTVYFHMSEPELIEMELRDDGSSFSAIMNRMVESENVGGLVREFKKILLAAYGEKSEDGQRFIKSPQMREEFEQSAVYSVLFMEFATDVDAGTNFINSLVPKELMDRVNRAAAEQQAATTPEFTTEIYEAKHLPPPNQ